MNASASTWTGPAGGAALFLAAAACVLVVPESPLRHLDDPCHLGIIGFLLVLAAISLLRLTSAPAAGERLVLATFLAGMPIVYLGRLALHPHATAFWWWIEGSGVVLFLAGAALGWRRPWFLAPGLAAHGLWDLAHHERAPFIEGWYTLACAVVDGAMAFYAATRGAAWRGRERAGAPLVPALGFAWLTRLYDPVLALFGRERRFKSALIEQAALRPGMRILDLGCGTATLSSMLASACNGVEVVGLDGDGAILAIAAGKIAGAPSPIRLVRGSCDLLPFPDCSFDLVVSSLLLHHLTSEQKARTLAEARRVLRPGGQLHVADWGRPSDLLMRAAFLTVRLLDGFQPTRDNVRGRLAPLMREAHFAGVVETLRLRTWFGTLSLHRAHRPDLE